ncbi:50S ribosomal protein L18 [Candidatus Uhrbacteria bacterium]|nr:50S ribosomal protein L18 [Candidatus Uhrbacteria bacterium]
MKKTKQDSKILRKKRVRARISGTGLCPRLSVARGLKSTTVQLIDDEKGTTLASAYERELSAADKKKTKTERASALGALIAKKAHEAGVSAVVFDRGGNAYHGRVRAVAQAAREGGLQF